MLTERHLEKLRSRFPFLFSRNTGEEEGGSERIVEALLRLLSNLFLAHVTSRGPADERVLLFLEHGLNEPTLAKWIELQRVLVEERRVPFEDVFSLDFKRRDLLQLLAKRYLDYLGQLSAESGGVVGALDELVEFLLTYFKADLVAGPDGVMRLVGRDRTRGLALTPFVRGTADELEVLCGVVRDGLMFQSLSQHDVRLCREPELRTEFGELFLRVGAYRQALYTFEGLSRDLDGVGTESAKCAGHARIGIECLRKGEYARAISELEKALDLRGDVPAVQFNLAMANARLSNYGRAIQLVGRLVEGHPSFDRGFELLGDLMQMKGEPASARRMYERAAAANPHSRSVEKKLAKLAGERTSSRPQPRAARKTSGESGEDGSRLHDLLVDMTQEAEQGKFHPIVERESELAQMIEILCCQGRSNPLLIGEPGVGKTAVVEELAMRLVRGEVPRALAGRKLYMMSVASLLAGAKFRGQFEERVLQLVQTLKSEPCVLFIDDIHTIVNSGLSKGGTLDTSSLLKPALVRGEIQAIGATTYDEYRLNIEKDPSLVRSFQLVDVEEPTPEQMSKILVVHLERLSRHHGVVFEQLDLSEIARLIKICLRERRLPDVAINVLDRAAARVCLDRAANERGDGPDSELIVVTRDDIGRVLSEMSGVPVARLTTTQTDRFINMERILADRVIGQADAVNAVAQVIRTSKMNFGLNASRPDGVFLFVGPSGVGKTELARTIAEFLFGNDEKVIRIDMSEYMEKISSSRLIGTAPGYVGYNDQNQLTDQVRKNPYSLVLLDEIEKADSQMLNLFLQVFDAGRLTDGKGRTVHFSNATIVMTSNVGTHLYSRSRAGYGKGGNVRIVSRGEIMKEVKRFFPPEFLNRIDEIVLFRQLDPDDLKTITRVQMRDLVDRLMKQGIELEVSDEVCGLLAAEGYSEEFGARKLARTIRRRILDPLAVLALNSPWDLVERVIVTEREGRIEVSLSLQGSGTLEPLELPAAEEADIEASE